MINKVTIAAELLLVLVACGAAGHQSMGRPQRLILATTTSTADSGLLDHILPDFERRYNATVDVVAVGTGQALVMGAAGNADVLLVHAPTQEEAFVEAGDGLARYDVMYNDFVIVGPADDPAGIRGLESAAEAFRRIGRAGVIFVSRGDESGTHAKELAIWEAAGLNPAGEWYQSGGQGMGETLSIAEEQRGYALSDRATYLARQAEGLALEVLVEGDPILFNPYGVIPVNPAKHPGVNDKLAHAFVNWITAPETQALIADFRINGQQVFFPHSGAWRAAHP